MLDKSKFVTIMTGLCEIYKQTPSQFIYDMYYDIFKDYEDTQFSNSIKKVLSTYKYNTLPKPADILEYLDGSSEDKSLIAWLKAKEAVVKGGYPATIEFDDPVISNCIKELGGWDWFCKQEIENLCFVEKRFRDLYKLFQKRETNTPVKLIGFIENKNSNLGFKDNIPRSIKIGFDKEDKELKKLGA